MARSQNQTYKRIVELTRIGDPDAAARLLNQASY